MYRYHVSYVLQVPDACGGYRYYFGDLTVERSEPVTTAQRVVDLKRDVALHQTQFKDTPDIEWITILNLIELASRP